MAMPWPWSAEGCRTASHDWGSHDQRLQVVHDDLRVPGLHLHSSVHCLLGRSAPLQGTHGQRVHGMLHTGEWMIHDDCSSQAGRRVASSLHM